MRDLLGALPPSLLLPVVTLLLIAEAGTIPGMLVPGTAVLLSLGLFAQTGLVSLTAALCAAVCGAVLGPQLGYYNGRRWRLHALPPLIPTRAVAAWERAGTLVARYGVPAVAFGQWLFAARLVTPRLAGYSGVPYRTYTAANAPSAVLWAITITTAGYLLGVQAHRLFSSGINVAAAILVIAVAGGLYLIRRARRRPEAPAPDSG